MNLAECLKQVPPQHVLRIAHGLGFDSRTVSPDLLVSLPSRIKDGSYLTGVVSELGDEEITALKMVALCGGGKGIVVEKCHQKLNELTRKWRRNGAKVLDSLIRSGLVYMGRENYRQVYFVPADLRLPVINVLLPSMLRHITVTDVAAKAVEPDPFVPARHAHLLLSYTAKNPVKVAQGGTIYRRTQRDIITSLGLPDDLPEETESLQAAHPQHLSFLINYCRTRGLMAETSLRELRPSARLAEWVSQPASAKAWDMALSLYDEWAKPDPDVQTMLTILVCVPDGRWVAFETLLDEMESLSLEHSWHGLETRLGKAIRMLAYAGVLARTSSGKGEALRLTQPGRAMVSAFMGSRVPAEPVDTYSDVPLENSFFVQGTFEILVPPNIEPLALWRIESIADLVKPDQMLIYRITRQSVYRSFAAGTTLDSIMGFLEKHSKNEIPQNVSYSIAEWSRGYGRVEFMDALILRCDSEELSNEIRASKRMQPFIRGEIGPLHLIIDRSQYQAALETLESEGYMPKAGIRGQEPHQESD